jgi:filamentous hemagglutinin family protein
MAAHLSKRITRCIVYKKTVFVTVLLASSLLSNGPGHSAVSTSVTPTTGTGNLGTNVAQSGNLYNIAGGTRPGGGPNLFHSFGNFSVGSGDIANFQNTMVNGSFPLTSNILGRVTGGNLSSIFGTIQTTNFGSANLYLMNPSGFLFGPNTTINVGGMMTFTTADYLTLTDGGRFNANPNASPTDLLAAAPVAAFGFLGSNPAAINFEGGQLTIAAGTGLALVGGDINLVSGSSGTPSSIAAHGRSIQVTSVGGPGEVASDTGVPASDMALGTITLSQGSVLDTVGDPSVGDGSGGVISIRGGHFFSSGTNITTSPAFGAPGQGGAVTIMVSDTASLAEGSSITTSSASPNGDAGAVTIHGSHVILQDSVIFTEYLGQGTTAGNGGDVTFTGNDRVEIKRSGIAADFSNTTGGKGGAVRVTAPIIILEDSLLLTGNAFQPSFITSGGSAGTVTLDGASSVSLTRSGIDTSTTATTGNSGIISITAPTITIADVGSTFFSLDASTRSFDIPNAGNGGNIFIDGENVTLSNFATIQSLAESNGSISKGGNIQINGKESIILDSGAFIRTITTSQAKAGDIQLAGNHVIITGGSTITTDTIGPGGGGTIKISGAESIALTSRSLISTNTDPALGNEGPAGHIELDTAQLTLSGGTIVRSQGVGVGTAGTVTIKGTSGPAQSVLIDGTDSGIFTDSQGIGAGGNIGLFANSVSLHNGGTLSATTSGLASSATGGVITLDANTVTLKSGGTMTAASSGAGAAGDITVQGPASPAQSVLIDGSGSGILTKAESTGNGGNIFVDANSVVLQNGAQLTSSSTGTGMAGDIAITAGNRFAMTTGKVTTEASKSSGGAVKITTNPNGTVQLTDSVISASVLDGTGGGGSVNIDPQFVILQNSQITANAESGPGGNISITTNLFLPDSTSIIDASSQFGQQGTISIQSPVSPASGKIIPLGKSPLLATSLLNQRCAALAGGSISSFTVAGRDGLPAEPGSWVSSPLAFASIREEKELQPVNERETPLLSLRQIAPPGFLTQAFADHFSGCRS